MSATSYIRRVAVFFCLAALLLAAVAPGAAGLPLAILFTLEFFVAISLGVRLPQLDGQSQMHLTLTLPAFSPRPPPAQ
jgi:hypothetical protein